MPRSKKDKRQRLGRIKEPRIKPIYLVLSLTFKINVKFDLSRIKKFKMIFNFVEGDS